MDGSYIGEVPAACFFDFDGLLVDTAALWHSAYREVWSAHDGDPNLLDLPALDGASVEVAATTLSAIMSEPIAPAHVRRELTRLFRTTDLALLPGALTLLTGLPNSVTLMVVTNGPEWLVAESLSRIGISHYFEAVVGASRVENPKPAPDVYRAACLEAGVGSSEAVALEDSRVGAGSARAAGLKVIGVSCGPPIPEADVQVARLDDPLLMSIVGADG